MKAVPRLARWLLRMAAAPEDRDSILADFEDDAAALAARSGARAARARCWRQARRSVPPLLRSRLTRRSFVAKESADMPRIHPLSHVVSGLGTDIRQSLRRMRQAPGFTTVAVLTLALGLGANTAVFTLVNAVILAPLAVPAPHELYRLGDNGDCCVRSGLEDDTAIFSWPLYEHLRDATPEFAALAAFQAVPHAISLQREGRAAEAVPASFVSPNYFAMFRVAPEAGRVWDDTASDVDGAVPVVISDVSWDLRFGRSPKALGALISINNTPAIVIGVMPGSFVGDTVRPDPAEVWMPLTAEPRMQGKNSIRDVAAENWLYVMGRLRPGVAPSTLSARTTATLRTWLASNIELSADDRARLPRQQIVVTPAAGGVALLRYDTEQDLRVLGIAALAVLLIACANLANLLLLRGLARGPELALRTALGAPRARLVREALVDAGLLTIAGAAASLALAGAGASQLLHLAFPTAARVPFASPMAWPVLLFAVALSGAAALVFAVMPAIVTSRRQALTGARGAGRVIGDPGRWARRALVVAQVALSLALVTAAGLLAKNVYRLQTQAFGFETDGRYTVALDPTLGGTPPDALPALYQRLETELARVPGVASVSLSLYGPLAGNNWSSGIELEGHERDRHPSASWDRVSTKHFATLGTPVLRGRVFDARDTPASERVAVVNETFVAQILRGANPIGQRFGFAVSDDHSRDFLIVGVVADAKYATPRGKAFPTFFLPFFQNVPYADADSLSAQTRSSYAGDIELWARTASPTLERDVRAAIAAASPTLSVRRFLSMPDQVRTNFTQEHLLTSLAGLFAALALLLACVGLYGVTAFGVSRRVREIGVRMALGANRARVTREVMTGALGTTTVGLLLGFWAARGAGQLLRQQLFEVSATDLAVFLAAGVVLIVATVIASAIPARRAATIDPIKALREG